MKRLPGGSRRGGEVTGPLRSAASVPISQAQAPRPSEALFSNGRSQANAERPPAHARRERAEERSAPTLPS